MLRRLSELLQAQMLQDTNINPAQPSLAETNLNIVTGGGPAEAGFNEFTPLFERNQIRVDGTGLAGNNDTWGGEGVRVRNTTVSTIAALDLRTMH